MWLFNHPGYPPNPPTRTLREALVLQLGEQEIQLLHHPGHTPPQTSVFLPAEGVVFTGDNVFYKCKTLRPGRLTPGSGSRRSSRSATLDVETIVPGHGEPCDKALSAEQAQILHNWIGVVEDYVRRGLSEDEAVARAARRACSDIDPYPIGQRLFPMSDWVTERISATCTNGSSRGQVATSRQAPRSGWPPLNATIP